MENKGLEYEKIGDKLSQSSCLGNSTDKIEEASEYYEKAAKAYFISKQCKFFFLKNLFFHLLSTS